MIVVFDCKRNFIAECVYLLALVAHVNGVTNPRSRSVAARMHESAWPLFDRQERLQISLQHRQITCWSTNYERRAFL